MPRLLVILFAAMALHFSITVHDCLADGNWRSIGPYSGGGVRSIHIDPANSQTVYTGLLPGGVYKSQNGGASWQGLNSGLSNKVLRMLAVASTDNGTMYAGTDGGLFRTTDGGASWTPTSLDLGNNHSASPLAVDPQNGKVVYVGSTSWGLFKTTDGGESWLAINSGIIPDSNTQILGAVQSFAFDPDDSQTVYVTVEGVLYKSVNGGGLWEKMPGDSFVYSIAIQRSDSRIIYAGTTSGVAKSLDGGLSWAAASQGLPGDWVVSLAISPTNSQLIYAATSDGVFRTRDGGSSWAAANSGLTATSAQFVAIDPANDQTVYAGDFYGNGMFKSCNGGATWESINTGLSGATVAALAIAPGNDRLIYAGTGSVGVLKSTNGGASWTSANSGMSSQAGSCLAIDPVDHRIAYAGSWGGGLLKTTDGGTSWADSGNGLASAAASIAMDQTDNRTIYAGIYDGVYKSIDAGQSWKQTGSGISGTWIFALATHPSDNRIVFAGNTRGLFKSSSGGSAWSSAAAGITARGVTAIVIDRYNPQIVLVGTTGGGVIKSTDGGEQWTTSSAGLGDWNVRSLAIHPNNRRIVYAGTDAGLFKSTNGGASWSAVAVGIITSPVEAIVIESTDNASVYVGTDGGGVFKTLISSSVPLVTGFTAPTFTVGVSGACRIGASGWPTPVLSLAGALPIGLTFDAVTGSISGAPAAGSAGTYPLTVTAGNGFPPDAVRGLTLTVLPSSGLTAAITSPINGAGLASLGGVAGTASGAGLSKTEVQISDGSYYLQADGAFALDPAWLPAAGTSSWSFNTASVAWLAGIAYTVQARASDDSTSSAPASSTFTIAAQSGQTDTVLSMSLTPAAIRSGDGATVAGSLITADGAAVPGQSVTLIVTPPYTAANPNPAPAVTRHTTDNSGNFSSGSLPQFAVPGVYLVQARFEGTSTLAASFASQAQGVTPPSGYAIIVSGKAADNSLLDLHSATTDSIYATMVNKRGFVPENVNYLKSTASAAVGKQQVREAITGWAAGKLAASPGPLYLMMVDHGSTGGFVLGEETLAPDELAGWLNILESDSGVAASGALDGYQRFVVVGACYSGIFAPKLSKAGRIVITSAGADEQSLAGFSIYNSATSTTYSGGEYFIDTMINFLGRGDSFKDAVAQSSSNVALRDPRKVELGRHSGVYDTLAQHPLLDDNGDRTAGYLLAATTDGAQAAGLALGVGIRALGNPADISAVTGTAIIPSGETGDSPLWLQVGDDSRIAKAWMEIRTPVTSVSSNGATGQVIPRLLTMPLYFDGSQWINSYSFPNAGTYNILYYTQDNQTSDVSPAAHSVVYKQLADNAGPSAFSLASPADEGTVGPMFPLSWQEVASANSVTYTVLVAADQNFDSVVYREEGLPQAATYIADGKLKNPATGAYYCQNGDSYCFWKVRAIDRYGAVTESDTRSFTIVETNGLPALLYGFVRDEITGAPIAGAKLAAGSAGAATLANGAYLMAVPSGAVSVSASAAGYQSKTIGSVIARSGKVAVNDFSLSATGGSKPGDCNADGNVSVAEVQSAIGMFLGVRTPSACVDKDGAGGVSLAELQKAVNSFLGL